MLVDLSSITSLAMTSDQYGWSNRLVTEEDVVLVWPLVFAYYVKQSGRVR
jgi:hypothetical protein